MIYYFDNAATTLPCKAARQAATEAMGEGIMNPSSSYAPGRAAAALLKSARRDVAAALGCEDGELTFTSGGTEADNLAIFSGVRSLRHRGNHLITTAVEHPAVLECFRELARQGFDLTILEPDKDGGVSAERFASAIREDTIFASIMLVNNETGAVLPVSDMSRALKARRPEALMHTDAVQGFLKLSFTPAKLGADLLSISAHKIHGLRGAGALYVKKGLHLPPMLFGGGQEDGLRSGTEALPCIAAFGAAARVGKQNFSTNIEKMTEIRDYLARAIPETLAGSQINAVPAAPHILSVSLPGYRSEVILNCLDAEGFCIAKSSACKRGGRSHVLEAMNLPPKVIDGATRISVSADNTLREAELLVDALRRAQERLK